MGAICLLRNLLEAAMSILVYRCEAVFLDILLSMGATHWLEVLKARHQPECRGRQEESIKMQIVLEVVTENRGR
jgi:hypothetical protein